MADVPFQYVQQHMASIYFSLGSKRLILAKGRQLVRRSIFNGCRKLATDGDARGSIQTCI
jgi:hypothetical protein